MQYSLAFPAGTVKYLLQSRFSDLEKIVEPQTCILLIDSKVAELHATRFEKYTTVIVHAEEAHKSLDQVEAIVLQLLALEAHRGTTLIGIGGGITTDITGFIASVYMRGIPFGFVPTTLLAMADAAIGGKNGVNFGLQKNLLGTIQQPSFILYDTNFLSTLPNEEWRNGFAEVIKYACLFDRQLFDELLERHIAYYQTNTEALNLLIERCTDHKNTIVLADEKESSKRKLLNLGHTAGHAIEALYHLPHGYAVAVGMLIACKISEKETGLNTDVTARLKNLLQKYGLPIFTAINTEDIMQVLKMDKKRNTTSIDYILLNDIGKPIIKELSIETIRENIAAYAGDN